jgi:hypothetical protein
MVSIERNTKRMKTSTSFPHVVAWMKSGKGDRDKLPQRQNKIRKYCPSFGWKNDPQPFEGWVKNENLRFPKKPNGFHT